MDNECDGIQCVNIVKTPIPKTNYRQAHYGKAISVTEPPPSEDSVPVGLPCQWLKKPKHSERCESNDQYLTCWKKDLKDGRM